MQSPTPARFDFAELRSATLNANGSCKPLPEQEYFDFAPLRSATLNTNGSCKSSLKRNHQQSRMRYASSLPLTSLDQAEVFIARDTEGMAARETLRLGLQRIEDDTLIGTCILFHLNAQCRRAEVGYELRRDAWSRCRKPTAPNRTGSPVPGRA